MANENNRFKKAAERARVTPGGVGKPHIEIDRTEEVVVETPTVSQSQSGKKKESNPLEGLLEQKERDGKSHGFYLSAEAAEKLEKLAKQNKCSKSKALDTLLRNL